MNSTFGWEYIIRIELCRMSNRCRILRAPTRESFQSSIITNHKRPNKILAPAKKSSQNSPARAAPRQRQPSTCNINVKRQSSMQQRLHFTHANKRARPHSRPATLRLFAADGGPRKALPGRGSHFLITVISKSKLLIQMPISHSDGGDDFFSLGGMKAR